MKAKINVLSANSDKVKSLWKQQQVREVITDFQQIT